MKKKIFCIISCALMLCTLTITSLASGYKVTQEADLNYNETYSSYNMLTYVDNITINNPTILYENEDNTLYYTTYNIPLGNSILKESQDRAEDAIYNSQTVVVQSGNKTVGGASINEATEYNQIRVGMSITDNKYKYTIMNNRGNPEYIFPAYIGVNYDFTVDITGGKTIIFEYGNPYELPDISVEITKGSQENPKYIFSADIGYIKDDTYRTQHIELDSSGYQGGTITNNKLTYKTWLSNRIIDIINDTSIELVSLENAKLYYTAKTTNNMSEMQFEYIVSVEGYVEEEETEFANLVKHSLQDLITDNLNGDVIVGGGGNTTNPDITTETWLADIMTAIKNALAVDILGFVSILDLLTIIVSVAVTYWLLKIFAGG